METLEQVKNTAEFNKGYEKGYRSKDYTWEDGIKYINPAMDNESDEFKKGYSAGQKDRLRDEAFAYMC